MQTCIVGDRGGETCLEVEYCGYCIDWPLKYSTPKSDRSLIIGQKSGGGAKPIEQTMNLEVFHGLGYENKQHSLLYMQRQAASPWKLSKRFLF